MHGSLGLCFQLWKADPSWGRDGWTHASMSQGRQRSGVRSQQELSISQEAGHPGSGCSVHPVPLHNLDTWGLRCHHVEPRDQTGNSIGPSCHQHSVIHHVLILRFSVSKKGCDSLAQTLGSRRKRRLRRGKLTASVTQSKTLLCLGRSAAGESVGVGPGWWGINQMLFLWRQNSSGLKKSNWT